MRKQVEDPEEPDDETTAEGAPPTWLAAPAEPQQDAEATSELEEEAKEPGPYLKLILYEC